MSYSRGAARERQALEWYRARGYVAYRAAGSHGAADVVAGKAGAWTLCQVKATARSPWASFGLRERAALLCEAEVSGATPVLMWWPYDRRPPRFYYEHEWPGRRRT